MNISEQPDFDKLGQQAAQDFFSAYGDPIWTLTPKRDIWIWNNARIERLSVVSGYGQNTVKLLLLEGDWPEDDCILVAIADGYIPSPHRKARHYGGDVKFDGKYARVIVYTE